MATVSDVDALAGRMSACRLHDESVVYTINRAHSDDIHGLIQLSNRDVVSGSKDGSIACWIPENGRSRWVARRSHIDYRQWVTALACLGENRWVSGTRDGYVAVHNNQGNALTYWQSSVPVQHVCKERNDSRIMGFGSGACMSHCSRFLVGQATRFFEASLDGQIVTDVPTYSNDWVYVLLPCNGGNDLLVVTGPDLSLWKRGHHGGWHQHEKLISVVERTGRSAQFISSLLPLTCHADSAGGLAGAIEEVAMTVFDGSVRIFDCRSRQEKVRWKEHQHRVWSVIPVAHGLLASSADDRTVKLWDRRAAHSVASLGGHAGRVSSLLPISEFQFLAATCPDGARHASGGATIICRDVRKISIERTEPKTT